MCRVRLISLFGIFFYLGMTYGTECPAGPGSEFQITCPGLFDSTKKYCCEIQDSFRCCDEEEFSTQRRYDDDIKPLGLRYKREYELEQGLNTAVIVAISVVVLIIVAIISCCCCCCACCPCYHWCHPNSTNVTIVQPSFGHPGYSGQSNIGIAVQSQSAMPQDPPPHYTRGDNSKLLGPQDVESNYIQ